jgi:uncharacterized protein YdeI (YjbR/CyaY-like superfamily)
LLLNFQLGFNEGTVEGKLLLVKPAYFDSPDDFRSWLRQNHGQRSELFVGFYKQDSGKPSITYREALDQALCFGWIDGVRKSLDALSYTTRFTPRRAKSYWSAVNIKRAHELISLGLMQPPGLQAFAARDRSRSQRYSFERKTRKLRPAHTKKFRANRKAWAFFQSQAPSYRRVATWWVASAKREATRLRRLQALIEDSARHRRIGQFTVARKTRPLSA